MSFLLLGGRGTGKTWLLEEEFREGAILWINLLENKDFFRFQANPSLLRQEVVAALDNSESVDDARWIIIDEVQRIPQLLNEVHALMEDKRLRAKIRFGLSGSSARKLKRGGANLLAGRALLNNLYPLLAEEIGEKFSVESYLSFGGLPAVVSQSDPLLKSELLRTYVAVYLREEIREEQIVRNLDPFSRFLEVAAQSSGQIINYSKIGRDCHVDYRAVMRYYQILEETLLGAFLPPYEQSVRKQQGKSPKFFFFDLGVIRALEGTLDVPITKGSYGYGRLFEHFFIWEVLKYNEYLRKHYKLAYLNTKDGLEIDLIVEQKGQPCTLIEIKSGHNPSIDDARHLLKLQDAFPNCQLWVVSQIERERKESNIRFLPWQTALKNLFEL